MPWGIHRPRTKDYIMSKLQRATSSAFVRRSNHACDIAKEAKAMPPNENKPCDMDGHVRCDIQVP